MAAKTFHKTAARNNMAAWGLMQLHRNIIIPQMTAGAGKSESLFFPLNISMLHLMPS
jgi:hypothetical protein